ncbi:MAG: MFS transporter [Chloroflexi bacterium]|nr:MAG: MFS transporter [Chloroflexota bacterium]
MRRNWPAFFYLSAVTTLGLALWLGAIFAAHPWQRPSADVLENTAILLVLTLLSAFSPIETRQGVLTVSLAPLCGAVALQLPVWAVMTIAALGTLDRRIPGRDIPWNLFLFNRGMWIIACGIPSLLVVSAHPLAGGMPITIISAVALLLLLNTTMMALAIRLLRGLNLLAVLRSALAGNALTFFGMPLLGILIVQLMQGPRLARLVVFLLYGPLLIYRTSMQKQRRLDTWLRDSYIMQSRVVDKRDGQTFGHSQRVGELCETVARMLGMSEEECNTIRVGGILHDLGKIAVPDSILLKPGKLTPEEYEIIKQHPVEGAQILAEHPEQKDVALIVRHHHERWDGAGYPDGLIGEAIPTGSRIVNACDAFDTITQARVFRPTVKTPEEAIRELRQLAGTWYDPAVIGALEKIVSERWGVAIQPASKPVAQTVTYRQVLSIKPFRLLWVGQAISYFGDMMNTTGLAIMLYLVTHSPSMVAVGLIAKAAPTVLFGLVAGALVDRFDRQRVMILSDIARAVLTITIPFLAVKWLPGVFVVVFLVATASTLFNPAKQAILPSLVPGDFLVKANSLISSSEKTMELLGFSIAGVIAAVASWQPLFIIDAATFIISAVSLLGVADQGRLPARTVRLFEDIAEGSRFILTNRTLRSTMALAFAAVIFGSLTFPILVVMSYGPLKGGAFGYGVLEAAIGAGAIVGALAAPAAMARWRAGVLILLGVIGTGIAGALTGFSQNVPAAAIFLFISGAANTLYYVSMISVTQREAPDRMLGRVMSSRFLLVQLGLLAGMAVSGPLTDRLGAPLVFVVAGVLLICAGVAGFAFRDLREATFRKEPASQPLKAAATG